MGSEYWALATAYPVNTLLREVCDEVSKPEWWNDEELKALVDLVPSVVLASTPLHQAHTQCSHHLPLTATTDYSLLTTYSLLITAALLTNQVHTQFSLLSIDHAYVTSSGRLLGVIRRAQLVALQSRE